MAAPARAAANRAPNRKHNNGIGAQQQRNRSTKTTESEHNNNGIRAQQQRNRSTTTTESEHNHNGIGAQQQRTSFVENARARSTRAAASAISAILASAASFRAE